MPIPVTCPECFMDYSIPEKFAGKKIKCKSCGAAVAVPRPGTAGPEADEFDDFGGPAFSPTAVPPRPGQARPAGRPSAAKKGGSKVWYWVGGIAGGAVVSVLLCCGGVTLCLARADHERQRR